MCAVVVCCTSFILQDGLLKDAEDLLIVMCGSMPMRVESEKELQQSPELINSQTSVTNDPTHSDRIDWIVARDGEDALSIAHHDMLSLTGDTKACLFQGSHGSEVIDSGNLWQRYTATSISRTS